MWFNWRLLVQKVHRAALFMRFVLPNLKSTLSHVKLAESHRRIRSFLYLKQDHLRFCSVVVKALFCLCCSGFKAGKSAERPWRRELWTISVSVNLSIECLCCWKEILYPSALSAVTQQPMIQTVKDGETQRPHVDFSQSVTRRDITLFLNKPFFLWQKAQMLL